MLVRRVLKKEHLVMILLPGCVNAVSVGTNAYKNGIVPTALASS